MHGMSIKGGVEVMQCVLTCFSFIHFNFSIFVNNSFKFTKKKFKNGYSFKYFTLYFLLLSSVPEVCFLILNDLSKC